MAHQCAAIPHTWCKTAVAESSSATAVVSVPNLRSKAPTHHQVFWLMQPGAAGDLPKRPARLPAFSWGNAPQWPPFGAKPRSCKYSYGVSPGFPPGSFYPPATQRSSKGDNDTMYAFISTKYHAGLQLSMPFSLPAAFSRCPPKNPHREEPPPAPGAEGGVGAGLGPHPVERK